jgi:hypothetical protein
MPRGSCGASEPSLIRLPWRHSASVARHSFSSDDGVSQTEKQGWDSDRREPVAGLWQDEKAQNGRDRNPQVGTGCHEHGRGQNHVDYQEQEERGAWTAKSQQCTDQQVHAEEEAHRPPLGQECPRFRVDGACRSGNHDLTSWLMSEIPPFATARLGGAIELAGHSMNTGRRELGPICVRGSALPPADQVRVGLTAVRFA